MIEVTTPELKKAMSDLAVNGVDDDHTALALSALCLVVDDLINALETVVAALPVMGALVGGLFGTGQNVSDEDADTAVMLTGLYERGSALRRHVAWNGGRA